MDSVQFQSRYTACELRLMAPESFSFAVSGHEIAVVLSPPTSEERARGHKPEDARCQATVGRALRSDVAAILSEIEVNAFASFPQEAGSTRYPGPQGTEIAIRD